APPDRSRRHGGAVVLGRVPPAHRLPQSSAPGAPPRPVARHGPGAWSALVRSRRRQPGQPPQAPDRGRQPRSQADPNGLGRRLSARHRRQARAAGTRLMRTFFKRLVPRSLLGQMLLSVALALLVAQTISAVLQYGGAEQRRELWAL